MNNFIRLLAIVSDDKNTELFAPVENEPKTIAVCIVVLVAIIIACILISKFAPEVAAAMKAKKSESEKNKAENERKAELERLHKIKEKNKRK